MMRKFLLVAALVVAFLGFGLSAPAEAASLKRLPSKVKMQVKTSKGAVIYSRSGKVIRNSHGKAKRLPYKAVRTYAYKTRIKGREYRRPSGRKYLVRVAALRTVVPKPVSPKPRVPKPTQPAPTQPAPTPYVPTTLVIGDSISVPDTSWWSHLQGTQVVRDAIGGTGMINSGAWGGGTFGSRIDKVYNGHYDYIMVAGGRNDWGLKGEDGYYRAATPEEQRTGIRGYLQELSDAVNRTGVHRENVYVMNFWGSDVPDLRAPIVSLMREGAEAHGFTFVDMPALSAEQTTDGTHPTAEGSAWLAQTFVSLSGFKAVR